ncbi:MAG: hypothetical protein II336_15220 [Loktanella sp.]|nr:hypothetical protein [Loktanella sp.]
MDDQDQLEAMEAALLEYVEKYGLSDKARLALRQKWFYNDNFFVNAGMPGVTAHCTSTSRASIPSKATV